MTETNASPSTKWFVVLFEGFYHRFSSLHCEGELDQFFIAGRSECKDE